MKPPYIFLAMLLLVSLMGCGLDESSILPQPCPAWSKLDGDCSVQFQSSAKINGERYVIMNTWSIGLIVAFNISAYDVYNVKFYTLEGTEVDINNTILNGTYIVKNTGNDLARYAIRNTAGDKAGFTVVVVKQK